MKPQMAKNGLIAFADQHGADPGAIWMMQKDGSGLKQLVAAGAAAPSIALSGTWLTYTLETNQPYHRQIYRINTDGTGNQQLTFTGDPNYPDGNASSISPDETMIAFFSGKESDQGAAGFTQAMLTAGHRNVAVIPATGGPRRNLTACKPVANQQEVMALSASDCIAADNPAWSPDGKWVIYDRGATSDAASGTWVVDLNGANNQRLYPEVRGSGNVPLKLPGLSQTLTSIPTLSTAQPRLTAKPSSGVTPLTVAFDLVGSTGVTGIDFGDGSAKASLISAPQADGLMHGYNSHYYTSSGTYTARVFRQSDNATLATASITLTPPPVSGSSLQFKVQKIQADLPGWLSEHAADQSNMQALMTRLGGYMQAGDAVSAESVADIILGILMGLRTVPANTDDPCPPPSCSASI